MTSIVNNAQMLHSPPIANTETTQRVLQVRVFWQETLQSVEELNANHKRAVFAIGEDPNCQFMVPKAYLNGQDRFTLGEASEAGLLVSYQEQMHAEGHPDNGGSYPIDTATGTDHLSTFGETTVVVLGPWRFELRLDQKAPLAKVPFHLDKRTGYFFGFSMVLHAVILGLFYMVPPEPSVFSFDESRDTSKFVKVMLGVQEVTEAIRPEASPQTRPDSVSGQAHAGVVGEMGDRTEKRTRNRSAIKGPPNNTMPVMKREDLKEMAVNSGVLSFLTAQKMPVSPFGMDVASGFDPENALGALTGDQIGPNFGMGGLGPKGTGRGGGGDGTGTIGTGSFGRIAWSKLRGTCTGAMCGGELGQGRGRVGKGRLGGRRGPIVSLKSGGTVRGSLSKETIRRIVRRHLNEIKFCYERELQKQPDLSGRVSVKFIIDGNGVVKSAAVVSSSVDNFNVEQCVAHTVNRMTFPAPENGGIVIVTYPFSLTSSG